MTTTIQRAGHYDEHTAYVIQRFPYAFGLFTSVRYWVETKQAYGQRLMTQIRNPATGEWWKPKHDGYHDIAIITTKNDPNAIDYGFVVPVVINLKTLSPESLLKFAEFYTFTPGQKETVMKALQAAKIFKAPNWRNDIPLDFGAAKRAEVDINYQRMGIRETDASGIPIQSAYDADAAARRAQRAEYPSEGKPRQRPLKPGEVDTSNMTPEQLALYNELLGNQ